jgi:mRNA interferase MazF
MAYTPERGDIIWVTAETRMRYAHTTRLRVVVISPLAYNEKVGLLLACPITSEIKGYPFEVRIPPEVHVPGAILADQVKSLDWQVRKAEWIGSLPAPTMADILQKLGTLLED